LTVAPDILISSAPYLLRGAAQTLWIALVSIPAAIALGATIALCGLYGPRLAGALARFYVNFIRTQPVLVLMFLCYYIFPAMGLFPDPYFAVLAALIIYGAAFAAEISRGAVVSVPKGQVEAARALGLRSAPLLWTVVAPQALRHALAPMVNLSIVLIKSSSYAAVVGAWELSYAAREIVERTLAPFQIFIAVLLIYFTLCFPLTVAARRLESRLRIARN
jgi:polar amino acid transport system permease protein